MNLTKRTFLKALGITSAVAASGVTVAKEVSAVGGGVTINKIESNGFEVWSGNVPYTTGMQVKASDGNIYEVKDYG